MTTIKLRRADKAVWLASGFILASGEPGLAQDTGEVRYGDGVNTWANLIECAAGSGASTVAGITDATVTGKALLKAVNAADARTVMGAQVAGSYAPTSHTHSTANVTGLDTALSTKEDVIRWNSATRTWAVRPAGSPFGAVFLSTNDATATAPTVISNGQLTGDVWRRHPDAS